MLESGFFLLFWVAVLGVIIGSFLTVCIFRIPYGREKGPPTQEELDGTAPDTDPEASAPPTEPLNIVSPRRSLCPKCQKQLLWWHNIPVLSWIFLKGKCYFCKEKIGILYPCVEALSGILAVSCLLKFGFTPTALVVYIFLAALIVISFIDIEYYIIPDVISLPGTLIGLGIAASNHFLHFLHAPLCEDFWASLIGVGFGGGVLLLISQAYYLVRKRVGLGLGDVKLLAMTGAFFGFGGAFSTMFLGSLLGSVLGVILILCSRKNFSNHLPFGPYLAMGTVAYIFFGPLGNFGQY